MGQLLRLTRMPKLPPQYKILWYFHKVTLAHAIALVSLGDFHKLVIISKLVKQHHIIIYILCAALLLADRRGASRNLRSLFPKTRKSFWPLGPCRPPSPSAMLTKWGNEDCHTDYGLWPGNDAIATRYTKESWFVNSGKECPMGCSEGGNQSIRSSGVAASELQPYLCRSVVEVEHNAKSEPPSLIST